MKTSAKLLGSPKPADTSPLLRRWCSFDYIRTATQRTEMTISIYNNLVFKILWVVEHIGAQMRALEVRSGV